MVARRHRASQHFNEHPFPRPAHSPLKLTSGLAVAPSELWRVLSWWYPAAALAKVESALERPMDGLFKLRKSPNFIGSFMQ